MPGAVAAIRVGETLTFLEVHGLTLTAHFPQALSAPIIGLIMGAHYVVKKRDHLCWCICKMDRNSLVQCFSGRSPCMCMCSRCRLPRVCNSPSKLEGVMMFWDVTTSRYGLLAFHPFLRRCSSWLCVTGFWESGTCGGSNDWIQLHRTCTVCNQRLGWD